MKPNIRPILILVVITVLWGASLISCSLWKRDSAAAIKVSGNIELTQVNIAFKIPGKVIDLPIEEGSAVKQGAVIARLDPLQIQRQRERDQAVLRGAETQLTQLFTAIEYQKAQLAADIDLRLADLRQAEERLKELVTGARKQEIQQATAAVEEARTQHRQAAQDWERAQILYKNDDISTSQRDQYKARFESTAAFLKQVEERLSLVKEGPRQEQIEAARAQVERARAGVRMTDATKLEIRRREQEIDTRRAEIDRARAQVAVLDAQLADAIVTSPISGTVLVKPVEVGEVIAAGTSVATLADLDKPWLRAYINEKDLGRVKLGAKVKVTTDSFPGKVYEGRISFISSEAEFTPKQIQTTEERVKLVYRIKIEVGNPRHELKLNMPGDAEIALN
jgi:HlyD family secretion protein